MRFYADLHIHSKYSRATSRDLDLEHCALWARKKGVTLLGTGDFTHPAWFAELREKLVPAEPGLFRLRDDLEREVRASLPASCAGPVRFVLQVEISTIYKKGEKTRKVHHLIYAPGLDEAQRFRERLARIGNIESDGRPILGLDSRDLLEITLESGEGCYLVPAHIWTPWFSAMGSKSGFDSIEACYGDLAGHIFAVETGLSSDPPMNWRISGLDRFRLVSNSDAHSPGKIGREACVFSCDLDYASVRRALETGAGYDGTVEFFPEEGKYHLDGHRKCGVRLEPGEARRTDGRCPECGKPLTLGVMHRVCELADRQEPAPPASAAPYRSFVPLPELLSELERVGPKSKRVQHAWERIVSRHGSELDILEHVPLDELRRDGSSLLAEAVGRMREGRVQCEAGYDGEYGVIRLFEEDEIARAGSTGLLVDVPLAEPERKGSRRAPVAVAEPWAPSSEPAAAEGAPSAATSGSRSEGAPADLFASMRSPGEAILSALDAEQRAAAEIAQGPLLVVAGPGAGKTRMLTHRIAWLVAGCGVLPDRCLAVTFTRRAAAELRDRLARLLGTRREAARVPVHTFHGLAHAILREHAEAAGLPAGFRVATGEERVVALAEALDTTEPRAARRLRALERGGDDPDRRRDRDRLARRLAARGLVDFEGLLEWTLALLDSRDDLLADYRERFRYVSIDEYQDLEERQYRLVRLLVPPDGNLCAIGDPDQAIYGFRGTDVRFFQRFREDFPAARVVALSRNYRSDATIVRAAAQAIAPSTLVSERAFEAHRDAAARITVHEAPTERAEAEYVVHAIERLIGGTSLFSFDSARVEDAAAAPYSFSDFAVLHRTRAQADALAAAFARSGIPHEVFSHERLGEHPTVRSLLAAVGELPADRPVADRLDRAADALPEGTRDLETVLAALRPVAARCGDDAARFASEILLGEGVDLFDPGADRVALLTLHAAKGLEFEVVFLAGCEDGLLPLRFGDGPCDDLAEERRLFFVGMTRARDRLFLTRALRRRLHGTALERRPSPFLSDLESALLDRERARTRRRADADQLTFF